MMRLPRALFITGTDTGVGKTAVAAGLAAWCRLQGMNVGVIKPVATGGTVVRGRLVSEDARVLKRAAGATDPWAWVNPVCYRQSLAPYTAARLTRRPVAWPPIDRAVRALAARHDFLLIEGVGGLEVPLTRTQTVSDLIHRLGAPVLIVARLGLGTLNHTRLTVEQARRKRLRIAGVVLNSQEPRPRHPGASLAHRTNPSVLAEWLPVPVWGVLPYCRACAGATSDAAAMARWIERGIGRRWRHWLQALVGV